MFIAASQLRLQFPWWIWPASFISLIIVYLLLVVVYRLYFHPLSKFPCPKSAAISDFWLCSRWIGGFWPREIEAAHAKYGYVIIKYSKFYRQSDTGQSIGMESDPVKHQEVRKMLAPGFSAPTLKAQMPLVIKYVDRLVDRWVPLNMRSNLLAVKGKSHPWIDVLRNSGPQVALGYILRRQHPMLVSILTKLLVNEKARRSRVTYVSMTRAMAAKRLADKSAGRVDLFAHLISGKGEDTTLDFLAAQGSTLIAAGSETGATFLSATTYYLISNSDMLDTVKTEVRQAYGSDAEIDGENLKKLVYLNAVIEEGLRIFPPASFGLPRVCPGAEIDGHWVPKGTIISSANHVTVQNPAYFFLPDEFHPERWLPSDHPLYDPRFAGDVKEASKPFSLGPRWCVGANLAYQEIRLVLAKLAWNFDWKFGADSNIDFKRDARLLGLWKVAPLRVCYTPVVRVS
ncbi:cytochrome P450 [Leptodontidium sp. 2 PMI_412]|nr:cytochrome P450 [Leptodontidium sp. 2 PMI_412]